MARQSASSTPAPPRPKRRAMRVSKTAAATLLAAAATTWAKFHQPTPSQSQTVNVQVGAPQAPVPRAPTLPRRNVKHPAVAATIGAAPRADTTASRTIAEAEELFNRKEWPRALERYEAAHRALIGQWLWTSEDQRILRNAFRAVNRSPEEAAETAARVRAVFKPVKRALETEE